MKINKSTLKRMVKEVISEVTPVFPQASKQKPVLNQRTQKYNMYPATDFKLGGGEEADLLKSLYVGLHDDLKRPENKDLTIQNKIKDAIEQVETAFELGAKGLLDIQKDPASKYTQKDYEGERYGAPDRDAGMPSKPELKYMFQPSSYKSQFDQAKDKVADIAKKPVKKPAERSGGYMTIGGVPFYGQREDLGGVYESKTITKSTLRQIIREEATKLVEMERLKRLQARDKLKKLEAQLAFNKKAQEEAASGMLDDAGGMGGAAYMDTDYRDSLKKREAEITAEIEKLKNSKLAEMKRLKKFFARDAKRGAASSDINKLYTLSVLAPNHDLVTQAGGKDAILKKIREAGYGVYSGLKDPHRSLNSREIFNQNIEDMYNLAHGEDPAFEGDEDMHTYDSLNDKQKEDLYYKVWNAYNKPGDYGREQWSIWADDFDLDS